MTTAHFDSPIAAPAGIQTRAIVLPNGTTLSARISGESGDPDQPVLVFLHGFPEAAFIWDDYLLAFAALGYRCVAPNLRGFERSSSPFAAEAYRAKFLVQDIEQLIAHVSPAKPLHALVAHDWGGALAWNVANQMPQLMARLCIVNSPHPGPFLRELKSNPVQQRASDYMNFLAREDAPELLAAGDFARLWVFLSGMSGGESPAWMTPAVKNTYAQVWGMGLHGGCNYYRASPLRPDTAHTIDLPDSMLQINVPTSIAWGMNDTALLPCLLDGLDRHIPTLQITRIEGASHWVLHEQPARMVAWLEKAVSV